MNVLNIINPIAPMSDAFFDIWNALPFPIQVLFYISLSLTVLYALYRILSG